jgi:uncharacterized phage-like protein YoqJ
MILAGTGHRNQKLGGFQLPNPTYIKVCQAIEKNLLQLKPEKVISGMALGYDQWLANIAIKLKIPLIAAVPFKGQESVWAKASQAAYNRLLTKASEIIVVNEGGYSAHKLQLRNEWLVNHCDLLLACWNGDESSGTYNCINYAKLKNKEIIFINPRH